MLLTGCLARRMTYHPPDAATPTPPPVPFGEIALATADGTIAAWWRAPGAGEPAVLFFYGNGMSLATAHRAGLLDRIASCGTGLLCPDYPGYGKSAGSPGEAAIMRTADAALAWLRARHPETPVVVLGQSLGSGVAAGLAARAREAVSGLALLAPFTSLADAARAHYPGWFVGLALRERYDSANAIPGFGKPVLVIHGAADEVIPVAQGRALAAAAGETARFVEIPGATHNDLTEFPAVWDELRRFLAGFRKPQ